MQRHADQILAVLRKSGSDDETLEEHDVPVAAVLAIGDEWDLAADDKSDRHAGCIDSPEWDSRIDAHYHEHGPSVLEHLGSLYVLAGDWKYPIYFRFDRKGTWPLTACERQGARWLAEQREWPTIVVTRRSDREFDLTVNREWFPAACLRMWCASYAELEYIAKLDWQNTAVVWREFDRVLALARKQPLFSRTLLRAVRGTWQEICADAETTDNEEALEMVLDADRIAMYGNKVAHEELKWLDEFYGYAKVQRAMSKQVRLV